MGLLDAAHNNSVANPLIHSHFLNKYENLFFSYLDEVITLQVTRNGILDSIDTTLC